MNFDFDSATRRALGYRLIDAIDDFYTSLPDRPVQLPADERTYGALHDSLPETGQDPAKLLDEVCRSMIDEGFHVPAANYFGLMNPTPTYMGFLGEALAAGLNPQLATLARSQLASKIELETIQWIGSRVGWPGEFSGTFTSGGNEANFSALALAPLPSFRAQLKRELQQLARLSSCMPRRRHTTRLDKSTGLLGIGRKALRRVAVNERLQLDPGALEQAIRQDLGEGRKPVCVVATAGTTSSGIIDDLPAIAHVCRQNDLWMHVDGAYGASLIFSDRYRSLVQGIELADSLTIDPHKWLAVPFAAGVVLTRHPRLLEQAFAVYAPYMPKAKDASLPDNSRISTQWTRRMNSLKLWLTLRAHGRKGYEELIARQFDLAASFADWIRASKGYELAATPMLPIVNFRLKKIADDDIAAAQIAWWKT